MTNEHSNTNVQTKMINTPKGDTLGLLVEKK